MGFTKLDSGIVDSSVWSEPLSVRVLWITLLAKADCDGIVQCSRSGLLRAANIPELEFDVAVKTLESPDIDSRTSDHEGRRIEKVEGGWKVLNYLKYRERTYSSNPDAVRKRKRRTSLDMSHNVPQCPDLSGNVPDISASASASVLGDRSVREGEQDPTWWDSLDEYHEIIKKGFNALLDDSEWLLHEQALRPRVDIKRSIRLAYDGYWGHEPGWNYYRKKPKKTRTRTPNIKLAFRNSLGWKNYVEYHPREQQ